MVLTKAVWPYKQSLQSFVSQEELGQAFYFFISKDLVLKPSTFQE